MGNNLNLMLHCGGEKVERQELTQCTLPASTPSWQPIPHDLMVDSVTDSLESAGLSIVSECHGLRRNGDQYFGMLEVADNRQDSADYGLVVGVRNSHDKSYPAGLCVGAGVFVCDNLSFSGEITLARRHTRWIQRDLPGLVDRAVGQLGDHRDYQAARLMEYRDTDLANTEVNDLVIRALDSRVIGATQVPRVLNEWRYPAHDDFGPRTAWSLFNAFTEVFKGKTGNAARTLVRSQKLHGIFDAHCGVCLAG